MKLLAWCLGVLATIAGPVGAVLIATFQSTHNLVERSPDIVIARCVSIPKGAPLAFPDGVFTAEIEVESILKGKGKPGKASLHTAFGMEAGQRYLVCGTPRSVTTLGAFSELALVRVPDSLKLTALHGMPLEEQVRAIFAARRAEVSRELQRLQRENPQADQSSLQAELRLLEKATGLDRPSEPARPS